ncbi:uncharacterized protein METZ01_LOCUS505884 [marine metagenome]|uniref:Uncharacterized protein n=1 Tax=marine metagenome TaxID=408172 RepID=A0A383E9F8_9ZZZZ
MIGVVFSIAVPVMMVARLARQYTLLGCKTCRICSTFYNTWIGSNALPFGFGNQPGRHKMVEV